MIELQALFRSFGRAVKGRLTDRRPAAIGLHLGDHGLHLVQFDSAGPTPVLRAATSARHGMDRQGLLNSPALLRDCLAQAFKSQRFRGRRVVTCLPPEHLKMSVIDYHVPAGSHEEEAVVQQAQARVEGGLEQWVVDYVPVRTSEYDTGERSALLAMAPRTAVLEYLQRLQAARLEVAALEIGPVAIARLVTRLSLGGQATEVLVVNFGKESTYLTIISGRRLMLDRMVRFGEKRLLAELQGALEVDAEAASALVYRYGVVTQATAAVVGSDLTPSPSIPGTVAGILRPVFKVLCGEIAKILIYHASQVHGKSVDGVYLLGSVARWPGIEQMLEGLLSLRVATLNPLASFAESQQLMGRTDLDPVADLAIATGCALREATGRG
ncbi:MAG: pilus assembly protein PilM [Gammaproteobacteria bacterium]